jgi:hypothetical protein
MTFCYASTGPGVLTSRQNSHDISLRDARLFVHKLIIQLQLS